MRKSWLMCVLLGALAWGQAPPGPAPAAAPAQSQNMSLPPRPPAVPDTAAAVPADAAVITVKGICSAPPRATAAKAGAARPASAKAKAAGAECKTVITKADFEKLASGLTNGNMTPQLRRQLASILPRLIAMSDAAKKEGLEKTPRYEETLKFAKMQILTNELQHTIQENSAKISQSAIEAYYKEHPDAYEQFNIDRLFVPRSKQPAQINKDEKLTEEQQKAREEQGEQEMTKLADSLRERAAAGEDFMKLQKEAFDAAGMKIESPTVNLPKLRRTGLPPAHASVFDLKPGQVSQVISDSGGHYIYKVISKETLPLNQVETEIRNTLQSQRSKEAMEKIQNSYTVVDNELYFGPPGQGGMHPMPPPRLPNPHVAPGPVQPSAAPQTPPPASKPD